MKIEIKDGLGDRQTPGWIELWSPNGGRDDLSNRQLPEFGICYVCYVRYTPRALGLSAFRGRAPLVFLFLFFPARPPPLTPPGRPLTERSKNFRPEAA